MLNEMFYSIIMFPMLALISQYKGNAGTTSILYTVAGLRHHRKKNERKLGNKTTNYQVHHQLLPQHLLFGVSSVAGETLRPQLI